MHEIGIAQKLVHTATSSAAAAGLTRVRRLGVELGAASALSPEALTFAVGVVARGTPVEGAELQIAEVPARVRCGTCGAEAEIAGFPLCCPACGGFDVAITGGEELLVDAVEVETVVTTEEAER
jgi:hydrogenase nickel incorporation protein HypA/HybF